MYNTLHNLLEVATLSAFVKRVLWKENSYHEIYFKTHSKVLVVRPFYCKFSVNWPVTLTMNLSNFQDSYFKEHL